MGIRVAVLSALAATAAAQVAPFTNSDHSISVHIPSDTASSGNGPIYFQISAPSGTQWVGFGQGNQMKGANMFVVYADGNGGVVLSPRSGKGEFEPNYNSSIQASLLDGSGVASDGSMVANVRCDSCLSWSGGSMNPTSTQANWIMAYKSGDALDSNSQSADIVQHDKHFNFDLDLTMGTGNDNPILSSASQTSGSASGTASPTGGVATPIASTSPNTSSDTTDEDEQDGDANLLFPHGVIMSLVMVGLLPLSALSLYLPTTKKVRWVHTPLNVLSLILLIAGLALGVTYGRANGLTGEYHQIIGYVVFGLLILPQPVMGLYQHYHYCKTQQRSVFGHAHRWLGRVVIALGIINGGLGWNLNPNTTAYIVYGVLAGVMFLIYVTVVLVSSFRKPKHENVAMEKGGLTQQPLSEANSSRDGSNR